VKINDYEVTSFFQDSPHLVEEHDWILEVMKGIDTGD
jgi:ribosomal protein S12